MNDLELIYNEAEKKGSWASLVPYPSLLFRWQRLHYPQDVHKIATVASHKLNKHLYCDTPEKCWKVEQFLQEHGVKTV